MHLPDLVLNHIIDDLLQDAEPFFPKTIEPGFQLLQSWKEPRHTLEFDALWSMTLVHRSWTRTAQRGFWSRAIIPAERLQAACSNQRRSGCLRELAVEVVACAPGSLLLQVELVASLLRQAPNIRSLYLHFGYKCGPDVTVLLEQLRKQECIERLWLTGDLPMHTRYFPRAIAGLKNIKGLVLNCILYQDLEDVDNIEFDDLDLRPKQLSSVVFHIPLKDLISICKGGYLVKWLLSPNTVEGSVKHLQFPTDRSISTSATGKYDYLLDCLSRLETLHLNERQVYQPSSYRMDGLLSLASNIRELTLTYNDTARETSLQFPKSLSKLNIQIRRRLLPVADREPADTAHLASSLGKSDINTSNVVANWSAVLLTSDQSPNRKKLTVSVTCIRPELRSVVASAFPETTRACQRARISLAVESYASFITYTEAVYGFSS